MYLIRLYKFLHTCKFLLSSVLSKIYLLQRVTLLIFVNYLVYYNAIVKKMSLKAAKHLFLVMIIPALYFYYAFV